MNDWKPGTSLGNLPPGYRADAPPPVVARPAPALTIEDRLLLELLAVTGDELSGPTTADLAKRFRFAGHQPERTEMEWSLDHLRRRGLIKYELGEVIHWRLSAGGARLARKIADRVAPE